MSNAKRITFLSRRNAELIIEPTNMISIVGADDPSPSFAAEHNLLRLSYEDSLLYPNHGIQERDAVDIIEFLEHVQGDVVVHCSAGFCRSAAIAQFAHNRLNYVLDLRKPCCGTTSEMDRRSFDLLTMVLLHRRGPLT